MIDQFLDYFQVDQVMWARPASTGTMLAAFAAVIVLTSYLYLRPRGLPMWVRVTLAIGRLAVLCVIVAALFEPMAVFRETLTHKRRLPVLIDVSESMSVKDQRKRPEDIIEAAAALGIVPLSETTDADGASMSLNAKQHQQITASSRLDLAKSLLSKSTSAMLESLGDDLDVSYYSFGKKLHMLGDGESGATDSLAALKADETGTFIAESLEAVAKADRGVPLAGIVMLTDGLDTSSRRAEDAVHDLGAHGIPVFPVPMGISDPDDVSIRNIIMQEVAFSGDKVPVRVQIRSKGYEKRIANMTLYLNGSSVEQKSVSLEGGLQFEDIFFHVDVQEKGAAKVEIAIQPFADEATAENNRVERSVRVVNEKINVLCMEGSARWEYRYLRAMLKRDHRINATFIATRAQPELSRGSSEYIEKFPEDPEEAFAYDLVILGDVDASFFSREAFQRLEELVRDRGGSLLMLCGVRFAPTSYGGTPLERMLPVAFDPDGAWEDVGNDVYPVLTPKGRSSLVMTLENNQEENDLIWSRVVPLGRVPPLLAPRRGATVLAELSDSQARTERFPLVAWQRYGTGKCMMIANDRFWLLRLKTGDKYHWRVWSQCIQFMTLSRLMGEHKRIRLETDRATYPIGEKAMLYAHVLDESFKPISQAGFQVNMIALDDSDAELHRVTLRPDAATPGLYQGYFSPPLAGRYRMEANSGDRSLSNTTEFQVADIKREMVNTDMQIEGLQRIADLSGGECLSITQLQDLPSLLNREPHTTTVVTERPLWDNGLIFFLVVVLLGFEWIVRRRYDLP